MLNFILPFYGIKNIITKKGNVFINLLGTVISLLLYTTYYLIILFTVTYLLDKNNFGIVPICNKIAERALTINGFVFPICYRCLAISLSIFLFLPFFALGLNNYNKTFFIISIIFMIIGIIDGLLQYGFGFTSTNLRRVFTGGLAGIGFSYFITYIIKKFFGYVFS